MNAKSKFSIAITKTQFTVVVPNQLIPAGMGAELEVTDVNSDSCSVAISWTRNGFNGSAGTGAEESTHRRYNMPPEQVKGWDGKTYFGKTKAQLVSTDGEDTFVIRTSEPLKPVRGGGKRRTGSKAVTASKAVDDRELRKGATCICRKANALSLESEGRLSFFTDADGQLRARITEVIG